MTGCKEEAETSKKAEQKAENAAPNTVAQAAPAESEAFKQLPDVVAKVNGVDLLKKDLEKIYAMISAQANMTGEAKSDKDSQMPLSEMKQLLEETSMIYTLLQNYQKKRKSEGVYVS